MSLDVIIVAFTLDFSDGFVRIILSGENDLPCGEGSGRVRKHSAFSDQKRTMASEASVLHPAPRRRQNFKELPCLLCIDRSEDLWAGPASRATEKQ